MAGHAEHPRVELIAFSGGHLGDAPGVAVDRVHFSVTAPREVQPGDAFVLDVWGYLEGQREAVVRRAHEAAGGREIAIKSKGPVGIARGTSLSVHLTLEGLVVEDPDDTLWWEGEIANASFAARVPREMPAGPVAGCAQIYAAGFQVVRVHFTLQIGRATAQAVVLPARASRHRKAFASYAHEDRDEVLARIQGLQKAAPDLDVFLDVLSLRSGQDWAQQLWQTIPASDVFYLFWSDNARRSEWVEREWRCGLDTRGLEFIDPIPLVSPQVAPPPRELASKHFDDWTLAFRRAGGSRRGA